MKLIIVGGSGYLAGELVRQGLRHPKITDLIVLSRKSIEIPEDTGKLKQVIVKGYDDYPDLVRREFAGANACIWTVAITPFKLRMQKFDYVKHICQTCTLEGLKAMSESQVSKPFHFVYTSGDDTPRDDTEASGWLLRDYLLMRGETENKVLAFGKDHPEKVTANVAKPGLILSRNTTAGSFLSFFANNFGWMTGSAKYITLEETAAALLSQTVHGFEKETLDNQDLKRIGLNALRATNSDAKASM